MVSVALNIGPFCVAFVLVSSGCLGAGGGSDVADEADVADDKTVWARIQALLADVPCEAPVIEGQTSANLKLLARTEFEARGTLQADHHGDRLLLSRPGGFALVDVSDPLVPIVLSEYSEAGGSLDVKFTPDGMTAMVGTGDGVSFVDIRDPETPTPAGEWSVDDVPMPPEGPTPGLPVTEAHMIFAKRIHDIDWVFIMNIAGTGVWIMKLEGTPDARKLTYVTQTLPYHGAYGAPHNVYIEYDEVDREWLMYVANGFDGWMVFNVDDPANPLLLGGWTAPSSGFEHTAVPAWIGKRRLVVTMAEVGLNFLKIYDATDLRAPVLLSLWQAESTAPNRPQHEIQIVDDLLYFAAYGHGIYVFDLTTVGETPAASGTELEPMAHYAHTAGQPGEPVLGYKDFKDVLVLNGIVYGSNGDDGLHVLGFGCNEPGDPLLTSDA